MTSRCFVSPFSLPALLFLLLTFCLVACDSGGDKPATPKKKEKRIPSIEQEWINNTLHLQDSKGERYGEARFTYTPTAFSLSPRAKSDPFAYADKPPLKAVAKLKAFPPNTKITLGSETGVVDASGEWSADVDISAAFVDATIADLQSKETKTMKPKLILKIEYAEYGSIEASLPPVEMSVLRRAFPAIQAKQGLSISGEPPAPGKPRTALVMNAQKGIEEIVGKAPSKLVDIDLVVLQAYIPSGPKKTCTGYEKYGDIDIEFMDLKVTAIDRRTGAVVREELLKNEQKCPDIAWVNTAENRSINPVVQPDAAKKIANDLLGIAPPSTP